MGFESVPQFFAIENFSDDLTTQCRRELGNLERKTKLVMAATVILLVAVNW